MNQCTMDNVILVAVSVKIPGMVLISVSMFLLFFLLYMEISLSLENTRLFSNHMNILCIASTFTLHEIVLAISCAVLILCYSFREENNYFL